MGEKIQYLIVGAGHQGLAMAAHFSLCGEDVLLWNRTEKNIRRIIETKAIECKGLVNGRAYVKKASSHIEDVLTNTIFVATPSTAHREIARQLAKVLLPDTIIYLNPGRTFGAIEFLETIQECGCSNIPTVVETQSIVYTCRRNGDMAHIFMLKDKVAMAYIGTAHSRSEVLNRIPECIRDKFEIAASVLDTSLGNIGMILHCAPVLLNSGWIESPKHNFLYYYDGITSSVGKLLENLDQERMNVAERAGADTISLVDWFYQAYGVKGDSIYECIKKNNCYREIEAPSSLSHRYINEDIPNGLVPLEYLGKSIGVEVRVTSLVIELAEVMCEADYREIGRKYSMEELKKYVSIGWKTSQTI